jgi:hypothetical protein
MTGAVIVGTDVLVDDRLARANVVAWAVESYPAAVTPPVSASALMVRVEDVFMSDEAVTTGLLCELLAAPAAAIEPSLVARLVNERRYGARLYRDAFDLPVRSWHGDSALGLVVPRACPLLSAESVVVVSPRARLEVMMKLLSTGWADKISGVVCGDDLEETADVAAGLLEAAMRRLHRAHGVDVRVRLRSWAPPLIGAAASLGIAPA